MANEFKIKKGLIVTGSSGGTVVDIQGSQGQLFSVTDDLSGSIFAVSDISGVPIFDVNSSGLSTFDGLVSGITPVNAANFVTKAYADGLTPGAGVFLPLTGGTLSGPGNLTVGGTTNLSSTLTVGADTDGHDVKFFGNATGEYMQWDESTSALNIRHVTNDSGFNVFTVSGAVMTQPQLRVGRNSGQYWGVYTDDRNAHLVHKQDETTGTMTTRFDQWDNNTSDTSGSWLWRHGTYTGGAMTNALTLTQGGDATFAGNVTAPTFIGNVTGNLTGIVTATSSLADGVTGTTQGDSDDSELIATTAFVQNLIETIPAGLVFQGTWDARTAAEGGAAGNKGNPALTSGVGTTGNFYIVSNAGSVNLDGITDWKVGDWAVFIEQGQNDQWEKIDNSSVLDGIGTGLTLPLWAGSGTSNTLDDSIITQSNTSASAIATISSTSDYQLRLHSTNTWSGIQFDDNGPAPSTIWHNATYGTFALGGGGSNVSGKKLHVHGAASIGSSYAASAAPSNGLIVEGNVGIGTDSPDGQLDVTDGNSKMVFDGASSDRPLMYFQHNAVPVDGEEVGLFDFRGYNSASQDTRYVIWTAKAEDVTDGTEDGSLQLKTMKAGTATTTFTGRSGKVGIANDNPAQALDVTGKIRVTDDIILAQQNGRIDYDNGVSTGALRFFSTSGNTERMRITSAGDVGIGTTSPDHLLDLYKSTSTTSSTTGTTLQRLWNYVGADINQQKTFIDFVFQDNNSNEYPQVRIGAEVGQNGDANTQEKEGSGAFVVYTNNATGVGPGSPTGLAERFRVDYAGNVGIGTTGPTTPLHVMGIAQVVTSGNAAFYEGNGVRVFGSQSYNFKNSPGNVRANINVEATGVNSGNLTLYNASNVVTTKLNNAGDSYLNGGNVGIGTTSPLNKLTAQASNTGTQVTTVPVAKFINTGNIFSKLILGSDNANFDGVVSMDNDSTLANTKLRIYIGNGTTATTGHSNDHIVLQGNGNVGIGTSTPNAKLDIQGTQGQLFSVTDNLSGSIFAVADISGVPIFDVNSSGLSTFDGNINVNAQILTPGGSNLGLNPNTGLVTVGGTLQTSSNVRVLGQSLFLSTSSVFNKITLNGTDMEIWSGALFPSIDITNTGLLKFGAYALSGAGTPTKLLGVDNSGNVLTTVSGGDLPGGPYLPLAGGTMDASANINMNSGTISSVDYIDFGIGQLNGVSTSNLILKSLGDITYNVDSNNNGNSSHIFQESGSELMRIRYDGNVGIGTTSPGFKLEVDTNGVHDGIKIRGANAPGLTLQDDSSSSTSSILIQSTAAAQGNLRISADENNAANGATIEFKVSGGDKMRILANGNVGIGRTNPQVPLDVEGKIRSNDSNSGDYLEIFCDGSVSGDSYIENTNNNIQIKSAFATSFSTSGSVAMFIKNNQNVGIGTITPGAKLDVAGIIFAGDGNKATPGYSFASDPDTGMFRDSANVLTFGVGADRRMSISNTVITTALPLGVNTTGVTSGIKLQVQGNVLFGSSGVGDFYLGNYATANHFRFHTNNSNTYFDMNCGDIYWRQGTSTRYTFFPTTANMTVNGTITQLSDIRNKENIVEISDCISKVQAMRGVYYNRTDFNTEITKVGVIAQEVEAVLPELVLESPETGLKSVAYSELTSVLINAIKEQQEIIEDLKTRITQLEN